MGIVERVGVMATCCATCGCGLNSSSDLDKASSCWELVLGAWARLEEGVGLQLTDLVWGLQGVTKRWG